MKTTILWADAELIDVHVGYDLLVIALRDSFGQVRRVRAQGYIHFECDGVWDDVVVSEARFSEQDAYARAAWESICSRYSGAPPATDSPVRTNATV